MTDRFTTEVLEEVIGDEDLTTGTCVGHNDPEIWTGDWIEQSGRGATAVKIRDDARTKAIALCRTCPVIRACERQLQAFETSGSEVTGIMAGRTWRPGQSEFARAYGASEGEACLTCGRTMHPRPRFKEVPKLPEGHAWFRGKHRCRTCYAREIEGPLRRQRRAQRKQGETA